MDYYEGFLFEAKANWGHTGIAGGYVHIMKGGGSK